MNGFKPDLLIYSSLRVRNTCSSQQLSASLLQNLDRFLYSLSPQPFWQPAVKTNESTCPHLNIIHFTHPLKWGWEGTHFCPIIGWQRHVLDSKFQWMLFVNEVCNFYTSNGTKWNCNPFQWTDHQLCMFELWLLSIQKMDWLLHAPAILKILWVLLTV